MVLSAEIFFFKKGIIYLIRFRSFFLSIVNYFYAITNLSLSLLKKYEFDEDLN